jgi:SNF2 family DNA or RNA helicase
LILRELLLRQKVHRVVVIAPPSVVLQLKGEMESRFGLGFALMDRQYVAEMRRQRGWGINPWATHTRFSLSQALVRDEAYAGPLRDWLGEEGRQALLILDEAHNAAQASGSKFAIDSKLTRSIRDLAGRFEHKLFLSATPHNGHSNSFSALLEILDPTRFCRGVDVRKQDLADVMVRRLKEDLRQIGVELPQRMVVPEVIDGLPSDNPELQLAELLSRYREQRNQRLAAAGKRERAAENLVIANLQKRLLSSIAAFDRTLQVHMATLEKRASKGGKRRPVRLEALDLLQSAIDGDDERAEGDEEELLLEADAQHEVALSSALEASDDDWTLLRDMKAIAEAARYRPDSRVQRLEALIRAHLCPRLGQEGAEWNGERLLIFTEYADTKDWLERRVRELIVGSDQAEARIATFQCGIGNEKREAIKRSFNSPPSPIPLPAIPPPTTHAATLQSLEAIGERYHQFRAVLMVSNNEGLTSTYNRFHDPSETSSGLLELRRLHGEMDQAVLNAYGWSDVLTQAIAANPHHTPCGFGLDYIDLEEDAQLPDALQDHIDNGDLFFWEAGDALDFQGQLQAYGAITGRRKLPWRYRWPDAVRDDVLARLLALNAERYAEEVAMGLHSKGAKQAAKASRAIGSTAPGGKGRGRPAKASQVGETGDDHSEQMGLG